MKSGDSLATVLLVSPMASGDLLPLKATEYRRLCDQVGRPSVLLGQSESRLIGEAGLAPDLARRIVGLLARATVMAFELDRLDQSGISTVTQFDEHYPPRLLERLGAGAPPLLHAAGALELLGRPALGVVGSRDVSPEGAAIASAIGESAAIRFGLAVVSGGAPGVDQLAMQAAVESGGSTVGFLAESLTRTVRSPEARRAVLRRSTLLCTPYAPDAPFRAANALGRNRLVYAQALVALVVATDVEHDRTWPGAIEAITDGIGPVAVWRGVGEGPGNGALEERGAIPVRSIDDLEELLGRP